jgi:hypothetical protein
MATRLVFRPLILRYITHRSVRSLLQNTHGLQTLSRPSFSSRSPLVLSPPSCFLNTDASLDLHHVSLDFFRYLRGHKVDGIGGRGDETLRAVKSSLRATLTMSVNRIRKTMSKDDPGTGKPKHGDDASLEPTVIAVLRPVFTAENFWPDVEGGIRGQPSLLCGRWFLEFQSQQLQAVHEILAKRPIAQDLSNDSAAETLRSDHYLLLNKEFRLPEIIGQLMQTAPSSDEENGLLSDLVEQFAAAMLRFLEMQGGLTKPSSSEESVEVRMKTVMFEGWEDAWGSQYRGDALKNLEKKLLSLSTTAARTDPGMEFVSVSRLIPIVQASGAGKSRLADMYQTIRLLN